MRAVNKNQELAYRCCPPKLIAARFHDAELWPNNPISNKNKNKKQHYQLWRHGEYGDLTACKSVRRHSKAY